MTLDHTALCEKALELESETKRIRLDPLFASVLEALLHDVFENLCPRPSDYEQRRLLVQTFNSMAKDTFGSNCGFPIIEVFGSFIMDLFTARSDLDLSLNFSNDDATDFPRDKKISILKKFAKSLYAHQRRGKVSKVSPIMRARVPVLKVVDCRTGIECDISVENKDGISRSSILKIISSIDERFRRLSYLMKVWAKAHHINSSKDRTMNSLTIITLVAFHLQTQDPPILPPFATLFKDGLDASSLQNVVLEVRHLSQRNEEPISKLFVGLLSKLDSVESLWQHGLCASTYDGKWIYKTWKSGVGNLSVEDFLDRSQNFARSVGKAEMVKINKCIRSSVDNLSRCMNGQVNESALKGLLFGSIPLNFPSNQQIPNEGGRKKKRGKGKPADPNDGGINRKRGSDLWDSAANAAKSAVHFEPPAPHWPVASKELQHLGAPVNNYLPAPHRPVAPPVNNYLPAPHRPMAPRQLHGFAADPKRPRYSGVNNPISTPFVSPHRPIGPHEPWGLQPSYRVETPPSNWTPTPLLHHSTAPLQPHDYHRGFPSVPDQPYALPRHQPHDYLGFPSVPDQPGYAMPRHPRPSIPHNVGYQPQQHHRPPFGPRSDYMPQFSSGCQQHHQLDQNRSFRW